MEATEAGTKVGVGMEADQTPRVERIFSVGERGGSDVFINGGRGLGPFVNRVGPI